MFSPHARLPSFLIALAVITITSTFAVDPAKARSLGATEYATLGLGGGVGLMTLGAVLTNGDGDAPFVFGGIATLGLAIGYPILAGISGSDRYRDGARGLPGMRIAGWIGYGLAMFDAVLIIGIGASDVFVPSPVVALVGVLGVGSVMALFSDMMSVSTELAAVDSLQLQPMLAQVETARGAKVTTYGLALRF